MQIEREILPIGTMIRAYDFEPISDRPDSFVEGEIIDNNNDFYTIKVKKDTLYFKNPRAEVFTPINNFFDWENRFIVL